MSEVLLWKDDIPIIVSCDDDLKNRGVSCLCSIDAHVYVTARGENTLYEGDIEERDGKLFISLTKTNVSAIDIACTGDKKLVYVSEDGRVFSVAPKLLDDREEILIEEDAKCCIHGHSTPRRRVRVRSVATSEHGVLFVTQNGHLWALGNHPHLDVKVSDGVRRVNYFQGRHVAAVACGSNFSLALIHKKFTNIIEDNNTDNESDDADVFVYDCPKCISESTLSLLSHQSGMSDICPLGLPLRRPSLDQSTSSTTSKENCNDKKSLDETTSPSTEDEVILRTEAPLLDTEEDGSNLDDNTCSDGDLNQGTSDGGSGDVEGKATGSFESEGEKKNTILINTEVARQFLTRQLSWVSSCGNVGEEFLAEYTEGTTRIVRQNVSNVANLVYEGVRTVSDKVATLSRHVSGGSDSCNGNEESFEVLSIEDAKFTSSTLRFEDLLISSSAGTSDHEFECGERIDPTAGCLRGANLLAAELYSWGSVRHGQLGIGDCIKRERPSLVSRLSGTGVQRICCGSNHAVALTLDGRMFAWGANGSGQVDWLGSSNLSSPCQVMCGPVGAGSDRTWDISAGDRHSLMLTHGGDVHFIGRHRDGNGSGPIKLAVPQPELLEEGIVAQKELAAHGALTWCSVHSIPVSPAVQDLALEQSFLEEGLLVQNTLVKPFQKKFAGTSHDEHNMYSTLCERYTDVLSFTALNAFSLWEYAAKGGDPSCVAMVQNVDEHIRIYRRYLEAVCNVVSLNGFAYVVTVVEPPPRTCELFMDRLPPLAPAKKGSKRNTAEAIIACALVHPLSRLNVYKCILQSLIRCNNANKPPEPTCTTALNKIQASLSKWEVLCEESDRRRREAEATRRFWESAGRVVETVRSPARRLIRESRSHPIQVVNSGRFSSHWLILLSDVLVHVSGSMQTIHPLTTLWVEPLQESDNGQHNLLLTMPEETQLLSAPTPEDKVEWLQALQSSIRRCLCKPHNQLNAQAARHAVYTFTKPGPFKDAKYSGRWLNGKMQGWGRMEWQDGRVYVGQFVHNQQHGYGRIEMPSGDQYEGQWRDGLQNGRGVMKFSNGDVYEGFFKDGQQHGHGVHKEGHFTASVASLYIGEWSGGVKQGYGVMDNIFTGEKYLGTWSNNMRHGCGLIVTLDGIYYEGVFMHDVLTGHGVMVFEEGTHYEGEFRSAGCFNGKGVLTLNTGDRLEGNLQGNWNEGVKVSGTWFKNPCPTSTTSTVDIKDSKPSSFGKLCVAPNQKWKSIFRQCLAPLAVHPSVVDWISCGGQGTNRNGMESGNALDVQRLWASVAVVINTSHQEALAAARAQNVDRNPKTLAEQLDTIPQWGRDNLDSESYQKLQLYLVKAFESPHHPLGMLLAELTAAYTATYGGVRVHPLLLSHAVAELHSLVARLYEVVRLLFPALPQYGQELLLNEEDIKTEDDCSQEEQNEVVSASALLHPFVLPRVHAALFVLYALHNKAEDDAYWKRLLKWNKQPDMTLLAFLGIDQKFWTTYSNEQQGTGTCPKPPFSPIREQMFTEAVDTLQQLKTTFSPLEKLLVIRSTFEQLTQAVKRDMGSAYLWTMDDLFPVFHFVVVRSRILQLGSEINFIEDFMERRLQNGELGIMFTTLKACYYQILQEKISPSC